MKESLIEEYQKLSNQTLIKRLLEYKENAAVLVQDLRGEYHIITEYDLIQAMA